MALKLEDLQRLPNTIRDIQVIPTGDAVRFTLGVAAVDILRPGRRPPGLVQCRSPLVAGNVILSKTEMEADGGAIPEFYKPHNLEATLTTFLKAMTWHEQIVLKPKSKAPENSTELLSSAAVKFTAEIPAATGFSFGQRAMEVFNQVTQHASI